MNLENSPKWLKFTVATGHQWMNWVDCVTRFQWKKNSFLPCKLPYIIYQGYNFIWFLSPLIDCDVFAILNRIAGFVNLSNNWNEPSFFNLMNYKFHFKKKVQILLGAFLKNTEISFCSKLCELIFCATIFVRVKPTTGDSQLVDQSKFGIHHTFIHLTPKKWKSSSVECSSTVYME